MIKYEELKTGETRCVLKKKRRNSYLCSVISRERIISVSTVNTLRTARLINRGSIPVVGMTFFSNTQSRNPTKFSIQPVERAAVGA